jgi:hypothetical protein
VPFPGILRSHCSPHADTCTDCHRYRHANKHRYPYQHAIPDPHGDPAAHQHAYADSNTHPHTEAKAYTYSQPMFWSNQPWRKAKVYV